MSVYRRGSIWWYEFVFEGQRIRESTKAESKLQADDAARVARQALVNARNGTNTAPRRKRLAFFPQAASEWMEANRAPWSKSNVAIQGYNLRHLTEYFGKMALPIIKATDIGKYQGKRQDEGASNRTINMEIGTLRMVLKSAKQWARIAEDVKMLPERKDVGRALNARMRKGDC